MAHDSVAVASVAEMHELAAKVAQQLKARDILLLYGELGSGKTTFVQGLARALGIAEPVTSPTFVIASEYVVSSHPAIKTLAHVDLYRLEPAQAASDPAVQDVLGRADDPSRLTVIEWADRLGEKTIEGSRRLSFQHGAVQEGRIVTFSS